MYAIQLCSRQLHYHLGLPIVSGLPDMVCFMEEKLDIDPATFCTNLYMKQLSIGIEVETVQLTG